MTARQGMAVWMAALVLSVAAIVALLALAPPAVNPVAGHQVAVIGSSLMRHAVPLGGDLLGDGRSFRRLNRSAISEHDTFEAVDLALSAGATDIFVEANILLFSLAHWRGDERDCDSWHTAARAALGGGVAQVQAAAKRLAGRHDPLKWDTGTPRLDREFRIDRAQLAIIYPVQPRAMSCPAAFAALVARARQQGTRIVLVLPPRSSASVALIGLALQSRIRSDAQALADRHGLALFAPASPWPNRLFIDHSHLNRAGRNRFIAELRAWYRQQ